MGGGQVVEEFFDVADEAGGEVVNDCDGVSLGEQSSYEV